MKIRKSRLVSIEEKENIYFSHTPQEVLRRREWKFLRIKRRFSRQEWDSFVPQIDVCSSFFRHFSFHFPFSALEDHLSINLFHLVFVFRAPGLSFQLLPSVRVFSLENFPRKLFFLPRFFFSFEETIFGSNPSISAPKCEKVQGRDFENSPAAIVVAFCQPMFASFKQQKVQPLSSVRSQKCDRVPFPDVSTLQFLFSLPCYVVLFVLYFFEKVPLVVSIQPIFARSVAMNEQYISRDKEKAKHDVAPWI